MDNAIIWVNALWMFGVVTGFGLVGWRFYELETRTDKLVDLMGKNTEVVDMIVEMNKEIIDRIKRENGLTDVSRQH